MTYNDLKFLTMILLTAAIGQTFSQEAQKPLTIDDLIHLKEVSSPR